MTRPDSSTIQRIFAAATHALQSGDLTRAEIALAPVFKGELLPNPDIMNIAGTLRMKQGRLEEAAALFNQATMAAPEDPIFSCNLGLALSRLGQLGQAETALRTSLRYRPDLVQALFELGALLHRLGRLEEAEGSIREALRHAPGNAHTELALAAILLDDGRPGEAEMAARRGLERATPPRLKAQLFLQLAQAMRRQRKDDQALAALDDAAAIEASLPNLARHRAETLQNLNRFDEAVAIFEREIARSPADAKLHLDYNGLLYQLGHSEKFLTSYDRAPESRELLLGKAHLLAREKRHAEAHAIYA